MTNDTNTSPRHLNRLIQRDLSARPDHHWMARIAEKWTSDEDNAILEMWKPVPCVPIRMEA